MKVEWQKGPEIWCQGDPFDMNYLNTPTGVIILVCGKASEVCGYNIENGEYVKLPEGGME